jgi:hypothetical protein
MGMSNTTAEFPAFQGLAAQEKGLKPKLVIVDGAHGGQTVRITADPKANPWNVVAQRLNAAATTGGQVEVVWINRRAPTHPQFFRRKRNGSRRTS